VNEAAITTLQLNGTDVAMTTDNAYVLQQITYEMLADVSSAPVSITKPLVRWRWSATAEIATTAGCHMYTDTICSVEPAAENMTPQADVEDCHRNKHQAKCVGDDSAPSSLNAPRAPCRRAWGRPRPARGACCAQRTPA
jgi:hypothetical protein